MSGDEISSEDGQVILKAVKVADAAHVVNVRRRNVAHCWGCSCGAQSGDTDYGSARFDSAEHRRQAIADAVLAALAGRLLPAGGEERTEGGYEMPGTAGILRQGWSSHPPTHRRTITEWPDGSVLTGPWLPVEEGTQT